MNGRKQALGKQSSGENKSIKAVGGGNQGDFAGGQSRNGAFELSEGQKRAETGRQKLFM